jgi:Gas vesicle synthesis protein GvpL/GvpF
VTVLLLYAVVPAGSPAPSTVTLKRFDAGAVDVLYEERDQLPSAEQADLLSFGEAVQALASTGPVLPVRFGTTLPDLAGLQELVTERGPAWRRRLDAVEGCVEMVVHAHDTSSARPSPPASSEDVTGTEYLLSRAAVLRHDTELAESVSAALRPVVTELKVLRGLKGTQEARVACLVAAECVPALRAALERWAADSADRHAEVTGPWPPYSFTETEDAS